MTNKKKLTPKAKDQSKPTPKKARTVTDEQEFNITKEGAPHVVGEEYLLRPLGQSGKKGG